VVKEQQHRKQVSLRNERTLSTNQFRLCVCVCVGVLGVLHSAVLYADLDKFKVSVSICYGSVISQNSSSLGNMKRCRGGGKVRWGRQRERDSGVEDK